MSEHVPLHPDVVALMKVVTPPAQPVGVASEQLWRRAAELAGTEYPIEVKQVNEVYGSGFFDGFLWVLNPAPQVDAYNLFTYDADTLVASKSMNRSLPGVTPDSLLAVAWTRAGDELFHLTNTERPWKLVVLGSRGSRVEVYSLTLPGLLVDVLTGKIQSPLLSGQFGPQKHSFA